MRNLFLDMCSCKGDITWHNDTRGMLTVLRSFVAFAWVALANASRVSKPPSSPVSFAPTSRTELKTAIDACAQEQQPVGVRLLNSGESMPMLGLGTWKAEPNAVGRAVSLALKDGYKHFDCAAVYGNEKEVGQALAASTVPRETLFVTSKLWNSEHAPENVGPAVQQTLSDLQLDYLDLYLVHWPQAYAKVANTHAGFPTYPDGSTMYDFTTTLEATWGAMESLVDRGLVKSIGLSNFNETQIERVLRVARVKPAVLQIESHPFLAQDRLIAFCARHDIVVTVYSPLASGEVVQGHSIASHPVLTAIGKQHHASAAQVAIAWQLARGLVVIPKSVTESRLLENLEATNLRLTPDEMERIHALDIGHRVGWCDDFLGQVQPKDLAHPDYPFMWPNPGNAQQRQVRVLNSGESMPMLGLGTWKAEPNAVGRAVSLALKDGYKHFDCAAVYGNEKEVGQALAASTVPRETLFVTSKLWNSEHAPENVGPAVQQTLSDLQLDYLDLYLVHWPQAYAKVANTHAGFPTYPDGSTMYDFTTTLEATWGAMESLVDRGLVKSIGLSNFNETQIERVLRVARVKPAVLQIESHPFLAQDRLIAFCARHDIVVTVYSPLASGEVVQGHSIASHPVLTAIGKQHHASAAQVAIAWQLARGLVVIPKSVTESRLLENLEATNLRLTPDEMERIHALDIGHRVYNFDGDVSHPEHPFVRPNPGN